MNPDSRPIRSLSRLTRWFSQAALVLGGAYWAMGSWAVWSGRLSTDTRLLQQGHLHLGVGVPADAAGAPLLQHPLLAWLLYSAGLALMGFGLLRLIQLMRIYERGAPFDRRASGLLATFALCIFLRELLDLLSVPLLSMVSHLQDAAPSLLFTIEAGQGNGLFVATLFLLLSRVMAAAHLIADDNERIV